MTITRSKSFSAPVSYSSGTSTTAIAERFGAEILAPDGSVDRARLGPIVFGDASARRDLEAIVHPAVYRAIAAGLRGLELLGDPVAVVDVPLLYETGAEKDFFVERAARLGKSSKI